VRLDPDLAPELINGLCLKDHMCTINPLYHIAKIYKVSAHLLMTYRETVVARNLLTSRREPWATSETEGEILAYSLLPCRIAQRALGLLTVY